MVQLGCAMDMMLLWVSSIISLELMAFLLSLGSTGAPKMILRTLDVQISLIVAPIFHSLAVYGPFWFCFRNDALVGLCYNSRAHDPINTIDSIGFRGRLLRGRLLRGYLLSKCLLRGHLLRGRLLKGHLLRGGLLKGLFRGCLSRKCLLRGCLSKGSMSVAAELHVVEPLLGL